MLVSNFESWNVLIYSLLSVYGVTEERAKKWASYAVNTFGDRELLFEINDNSLVLWGDVIECSCREKWDRLYNIVSISTDATITEVTTRNENSTNTSNNQNISTESKKTFDSEDLLDYEQTQNSGTNSANDSRTVSEKRERNEVYGSDKIQYIKDLSREPFFKMCVDDIIKTISIIFF